MTEIHGLVAALFLGLAMVSGLAGVICYNYRFSRRESKAVRRQPRSGQRPKLILGDSHPQRDPRFPPPPTEENLFTLRKGGWG